MSNWRRVFWTSAILVGLNFCCDNGWFLIGRLTEVQWWWTEVGIVFWSIVGGLVIERWLDKWLHGGDNEHMDRANKIR